MTDYQCDPKVLAQAKANVQMRKKKQHELEKMVSQVARGDTRRERREEIKEIRQYPIVQKTAKEKEWDEKQLYFRPVNLFTPQDELQPSCDEVDTWLISIVEDMNRWDRLFESKMQIADPGFTVKKELQKLAQSCPIENAQKP